MTTLPDLRHDADAVRAVKRPIPVQVEFAREDGVTQTLEGPVRHVAGDALITGDADDRWPVRRAYFDEVYEAVPDRANSFVKKRIEVLARRMDRSFEAVVGTSGDVIAGKPGDWLVQHEPGHYGIVDATIFRDTYDILDRGEPLSRPA